MKNKLANERKTGRYAFAGVIIAAGIYVFSQYGGATSVAASTTQTASPLSAVSGVAVAAKPTSAYVNGSYTGNPFDAYYGTVQVKAVVQKGKLTDVQFLQYPNSHSYSVQVNGQAMPLLTQEAIQTQGAQVNSVSGATFTSQAFEQSLASALTKARG
ncbi:MAG: FMN-binding protein [Minisyncoccota bacterium]